jgi:hypothetical protein
MIKLGPMDQILAAPIRFSLPCNASNSWAYRLDDGSSTATWTPVESSYAGAAVWASVRTLGAHAALSAAEKPSQQTSISAAENDSGLVKIIIGTTLGGLSVLGVMAAFANTWRKQKIAQANKRLHLHQIDDTSAAVGFFDARPHTFQEFPQVEIPPCMLPPQQPLVITSMPPTTTVRWPTMAAELMFSV